MEIFTEIWMWIVSAVGGITLAGIITAIIYGSLKGAFNRAISKINVQKITEQATDKGIERIKKISFSHSIQPLVESELKKVYEQATKTINDELKRVQENYNNIINVLEKLSAYFDNSIGINESTKAELKNALESAKDKSVVVDSVVAEPEIVEVTHKKEAKKENTTSKIER